MTTQARDSTVAVVIDMVRDTLLLPEEQEIKPGHLLFYDLSFTSMDMLDLLFRLEDHFHVTIPEGTFYRLARGELADEVFAVNGILTEVGRSRVRELLYDSPADIFPEKIHKQTLPRYCTVAALARLVEHRLSCSN